MKRARLLTVIEVKRIKWMVSMVGMCVFSSDIWPFFIDVIVLCPYKCGKFVMSHDDDDDDFCVELGMQSALASSFAMATCSHFYLSIMYYFPHCLQLNRPIGMWWRMT